MSSDVEHSLEEQDPEMQNPFSAQLRRRFQVGVKETRMTVPRYNRVEGWR